MALKNAFGTEAAASYLNQVLSTPPYADLWALEVEKQRDGVNQAAVSRVLAGYLALLGRTQADFDPRSLKDPVNRALSGKGNIAPETFELIASAFGFSEKEVEYWWSVRSEGGIRPAIATDSFQEKWPVIPLPYRTTSVSETHYASPGELTSRRHAIQEIQATSKTSRVQLRLLDIVDPSISAEGAEVIDVRRVLGNHHLATVALYRPLRPGNSTVFEYEAHGTQPNGQQHFRRLFAEDESNVILSVRFEPPISIPTVSFGPWADVGLHQMEYRENLTPSKRGVVRKPLEAVTGGMVLGFTWDQPQPTI